MRRVTSVAGHVFANHLVRLGLAAAVAVPFAAAQQAGSGSAGQARGAVPGHVGGGYAHHAGAAGYNHNSNAPTAPRFTSTFGPHSVVVPGQGSFGRRGAPDYASSWGIDHRNGQEHDGDRHRHRFGYGAFYPIYNTWGLMPWDYGYLDNNGYAPEDAGAEPADQGPEAAPPQNEQPRPPYAPAESDYGPPPPRVAVEAPPAASATTPPAASSTALTDEPTLTLIFKDGHRESVRNYALTGTSLIVLDNAASGRQQRIPLADLDLSATKQAAAQAGLDFNPPA